MDNLITISKRKLNSILNKHKMWLLNDPEGERADLKRANLYEANLMLAYLMEANLMEANLIRANLREADVREANLYKADLMEADLREAFLYKATLYKANLSEADLSEADLRGADLRGADLRGANLKRAKLMWADLNEADLYKANLSGADLTGANLYGAKIDWPLVCPEKGSFIGYKKCRGGLIVELEIPEDALRSSATTRKCRCSKAKVLSITNLDGSAADVSIASSTYVVAFVYKVGDTVEVLNFNTDRWDECSAGIHFFITRQEAVDYV